MKESNKQRSTRQITIGSERGDFKHRAESDLRIAMALTIAIVTVVLLIL